MEKKHYYYFDYIRVVAMCFVTFMHAGSGALRYNPGTPGENWHVVNFAISLAFSAVPLFFMMSGFLLFSSSRTLDTSYLLKKRIPKLLVPLIAWSFPSAVWIAMNAVDGFTWKAVFTKFGQGANSPVITHLWFMYTMIGVYLLSPIFYGGLNRLDEKGRRYLAFLLCGTLIIATLHTILPAEIKAYLPYRFASEILFFAGHSCALLLGWLLGQMEKKIPNWILLVTALADWMFIMVMTARLSISSATYDATYQTQNRGFEVLLAACIFLLCKQNLNRPFGKLNGWLKPLTTLTFPIYLVHNLIISILVTHGFPRLTAVGVLSLTLVTLAISFLLCKTLATIPGLCYLFTGLTWNEACRSCNWICTFRKLFKTKEKTA